MEFISGHKVLVTAGNGCANDGQPQGEEMGFFERLLPREDKFHQLMQALSQKAHDSAVLLKQFIDAPPGEERKAIGAQIAAVKAESKDLVARITREVSLSFITPFDREDIQDFSVHLYKIPKTIDKICDRFALHDIASEQGDFARQVDLICKEAAAMQDVVSALTHKGGAKAIVDQVNILYDLEAAGDEILGELLMLLFRENRDVRDLILRKEIYDMLEKVLDRYRDAAGIALQIVLKHS